MIRSGIIPRAFCPPPACSNRIVSLLPCSRRGWHLDQLYDAGAHSSLRGDREISQQEEPAQWGAILHDSDGEPAILNLSGHPTWARAGTKCVVPCRGEALTRSLPACDPVAPGRRNASPLQED